MTSRAVSSSSSSWVLTCLALVMGWLTPLRMHAQATPGATHVLGLEEALRTAQQHEPTLRQARATTEVNRARVDQARAPLLPQVNANVGYQRSTANFAPRPGAQPKSLSSAGNNNFDTYDYFNAGIQASQLIYDFGQTGGKLEAAKANLSAQEQTERATQLQIALNVRVGYFSVGANRALVNVAQETLSNTQRHLAQIQGFVEVGTRPAIDLAQARTDVANARLQLIQSEGAYQAAKVQLNQAMGVEGGIDYDVGTETLGVLDGEDKAVEVLIDEALKARPEFVALSEQQRAQQQTLRSVEGGYWPSLSVSTGLTDAGAQLGSLAWNWNAGLALSWSIFAGGLTKAQAHEARANLNGLEAKLDVLRQQVRVELEQAWLAVRTAKAEQSAADEALLNARERFNLADGRYQTGVGNAIELGDAQLALSNASAQQVQTVYDLATARAQLWKALGRL